MPKRRHISKSFQVLPLITALAVALSLFLAHNSTPLQQDSPPPGSPGEKGEKPSDDPKGNNPQAPPANPDDKPPPNKPPEGDGEKPVPQPGVPSVPE